MSTKIEEILAKAKAGADTASQQVAAGVGGNSPSGKSASKPTSASAPSVKKAAKAVPTPPVTPPSPPPAPPVIKAKKVKIPKVTAPVVTSTPATTATPERKVAVMANTPNTKDAWLALASAGHEELLRSALEFKLAALSATPAQLEVMKAHVPDDLKPHLTEYFGGAATPPPVAPVAPGTSAPVPTGAKGVVVHKDGDVEAYEKDAKVTLYKGDTELVSVPAAEYKKNAAYLTALKKASGKSGRFNFKF